MSIATEAAIERLIAARSAHKPTVPLSELEPNLSLSEGYAIQEALQAELERRGERHTGWKVAFTSPGMREALGVSHPIAGFLLASGQWEDGVKIEVNRFASLGVEVEVAFKIGMPLVGPGMTASRALRAVEAIMPALELPDLIFTGKPRAVDFIADSGHGKAFVLGKPVRPTPELDLALEGVVYEHNGQVVATHTAAEVMGNPLNALAWLADHLGGRGRSLKPGDVVMSGSISKILRPKAGDTIRATFTRLGSVSAAFV